MNLSKTEKLLAAKKKLREFQQSKMQNHQDAPTKQKHSMELSSSQCQSAEATKSNLEITNNTGTIENDTYASRNNVYTMHQDFKNSEIASVDPVSITENTNHEQSQNSMEDTVQDVQRINMNAEVEKRQMDLTDFPKVQKDRLLDMASAVADVLTNESDNVEASLDSDPVCRNQFLSSYLEEQKKTINELHIELSSAHSRILDLEMKLKDRDAEFETQLAREVDPLKEQLHIHMQTTGILIAEKAELTAALNQAQQAIRQNSEGAEEMMEKLKNSQMYIAVLEKGVSTAKNSNEELKKNFNQLQSDYDVLDKKYYELKKEKEDLHLEVSELKQKLNLKKTELIAVQQELQEKTALLSLSELRIQQMRGATPTEEEKQTSVLMEQELAQTRESLKAVTAERDEASRQYQNYVKQLDAQQAKLLDEMKVQKKTIEDLQQREQSYVHALSELEQQLQQEREKVENLSPLQNRKEQIDSKMDLLKNIDELTLEQEKLHIILSEKDTQIEILTKELNDLRETSNQEAEVTKLATALESEQLGASRAIQQNRQLKEQLTDMENAFVSLSNDKLDLTEQLQAERSIGRKLNVQLNNTESELQQLRETLREKEALLEELEKERLQNAQIADQMQHYQAQSHHANTFQRELQNALITIERLEKEKQALTEQLSERGRDNPVSEIDSNSPNADSNASSSKEVTRVENNILESEPMKQLEKKFKETMERVAELIEEKQKLEHLVLQLQSETETIGEYITLYQKQRAVLQNRAIERDQVFRQLLDQRNQQQEQLHKLKVLVSDFLRREYIHSNGTEHLGETAMDANDLTLSKSKRDDIEPPAENKSVSELLDVLTEIKDCKDSCMFEPNFHPCPWCSGKLLTV